MDKSNSWKRIIDLNGNRPLDTSTTCNMLKEIVHIAVRKKGWIN